jgi:hypothetical protein
MSYSYAQILSSPPVADAGIRETLRALLYARLNVDLPGHRLKLPPASLRHAFNRVRRFLEFVHAELGAVDLARVDQALLDACVSHLRTDRNRSAVIIGQLLEPGGVTSRLEIR